VAPSQGPPRDADADADRTPEQTFSTQGVLQEFDGGPGQIAIHGTNGLSDPLGTAASHGCVRLSTRAVTWLAQRIGRGVPLTIER
jgi:lipoprotein-anchoring transpeptidase ErfK/SrfK